MGRNGRDAENKKDCILLTKGHKRTVAISVTTLVAVFAIAMIGKQQGIKQSGRVRIVKRELHMLREIEYYAALN